MSLQDDLYLFNIGENFEAYKTLGAHAVGPDQWQLTVWAPNARRVSVIGDFNNWRGTPLIPDETSGMWTVTFTASPGSLYKLRIMSQDGEIADKIDPFAFFFESRGSTAARLTDLPKVAWTDASYQRRHKQQAPYDKPLNIYEVHAGSFERHDDGSYYSYQELADELIPYARRMGYTHIELMPLMEHPLDASWGYQLAGYFAPTSRFGAPSDFAAFVNRAHEQGIGVIIDWVPSHFIRNSDTLSTFDGTPTFEYADPNRADNSRWGAWNFDLGKAQVQSFLISSANYWLDVFHLDGLRVDAVSNMLYVDYDAGKEKVRNSDGGRENKEGIAFLQRLNETIFRRHPNTLMIAEESSAFPKVTKPVSVGGLGFNYKWSMGWMNDTLRFFSMDPLFRHDHMTLLTFSFMYGFDEQFILPFSHDEVVHGKRSLMHKMPGDRYNQFANLRTMFLWLIAHPGKKLLFMGSEWGQFIEWRDWSALEWRDLNEPLNNAMQTYTGTLNRLYKSRPSLWEKDHEQKGLAVTIGDQPDVLSLIRFGKAPLDFTIFAFNFVPVERNKFRIPVPAAGTYRVILNTESRLFGGTWTRIQRTLRSTGVPYGGQPDSIVAILPATGGLMITPVEFAKPKRSFAM